MSYKAIPWFHESASARVHATYEAPYTPSIEMSYKVAPRLHESWPWQLAPSDHRVWGYRVLAIMYRHSIRALLNRGPSPTTWTSWRATWMKLSPSWPRWESATTILTSRWRESDRSQRIQKRWRKRTRTISTKRTRWVYTRIWFRLRKILIRLAIFAT